MKTGERISGTYSKVAFTGTVFAIHPTGNVFVILDEPIHPNLPTGKIKSMVPITLWKNVTDPEAVVLAGFKPTDPNITLDVKE